MTRVEAKLNAAIAQQDLNRVQWQLTSEYQSAFQQYLKHKEGLTTINQKVLRWLMSKWIARFAFSKGEISYVEMVQNLTQAMQIKLQHLQALQQLNKR